MELNAETAARMAIANQRMNKGIDALSDNLEDWTKKLKKATKGSMDYAEVAAEVEGALKDLLGLTDNFVIPDDFLDSADNLELLKKAADGDQVAINKLGVSVIKSTMDLSTWNSALIASYNSLAATDDTMSQFSMSMEEAYESADKGMTAILDNITALTNGTMTLSEALSTVDLDEDSWVESLNQMAIATGMSVEEMRATLNSLGVQANIRVDHVKQKQKFLLIQKNMVLLIQNRYGKKILEQMLMEIQMVIIEQ